MNDRVSKAQQAQHSTPDIHIPPSQPKKSLVPLLVLLLGLSLIFNAILAYQNYKNARLVITPPPTSTDLSDNQTDKPPEFTTYETESYTFGYPSEWEVGDTIVFGSSNETSFGYELGYPLYVRERINYNQATGKPYTTLLEYLGGRKATPTGIQIDNQPALYISQLTGEHSLTYEEVVVFSSDNRIVISLYYQPDYYQKNKDTFNQILLTFKFTN